MKNWSFLHPQFLHLKSFRLRSNIKHSIQCFITRSNTSKFVRTLFSVFDLVMKYCVSCLIYYMKHCVSYSIYYLQHCCNTSRKAMLRVLTPTITGWETMLQSSSNFCFKLVLQQVTGVTPVNGVTPAKSKVSFHAKFRQPDLFQDMGWVVDVGGKTCKNAFQQCSKSSCTVLLLVFLELKVRKNWQQKTCNLSWNIAAKRVEYAMLRVLPST